jgi:hypothetical protein
MESQNESGQLIERVSNLEADENERCHHQIETEMHETLESIFSCGRRSSTQYRNQTQNSLVMTCLNFDPRSIRRQSFRLFYFRRDDVPHKADGKLRAHCSAILSTSERVANGSPGYQNGRLPPPRKGLACRESFLTCKFLVSTRAPACSHAVEDLDSPQHDDNGRYQRGHRQHTL